MYKLNRIYILYQNQHRLYYDETEKEGGREGEEF